MHIETKINQNNVYNSTTNTNSSSAPCTFSINSSLLSNWPESHANSQPLPILERGYETNNSSQSQHDIFSKMDPPGYLLTESSSQWHHSPCIPDSKCLSCDQEKNFDLKAQYYNTNGSSTCVPSAPISLSWSSVATSNSEVKLLQNLSLKFTFPERYLFRWV